MNETWKKKEITIKWFSERKVKIEVKRFGEEKFYTKFFNSLFFIFSFLVVFG